MQIAKKENFPSRDPLWAIIVSIVAASILVVYPLPYEVSAWRPSWMLFIMLFWVMCQPVWCGVWFAFALGIFNDLLMDTALGMNGLCFVIIAFSARFFTREKRVMTTYNLWIIAVLAEVAYLLLMAILHLMIGDDVALLRHWLPLISSSLLWPVVYFGLKKWRAV